MKRDDFAAIKRPKPFPIHRLLTVVEIMSDKKDVARPWLLLWKEFVNKAVFFPH